MVQQTRDDVWLIGANNTDELYTWVDATFEVHNLRSQTGGAMSLGHGMIHCFSNKQKSDEKSRTESELVATSDYVKFPIWLAMFMKEQGYAIKKSVLL